MSTRHLDALFRPRSVAFIGATNRPRKLGAAAMRNLIRGGFEGKVFPVNPKYESVFGVPTFKTVDALPEVPDLAIIATPPKTVPGIVQTLSSRGVKACIVFTTGLTESQRQAMQLAARPSLLRILGPDSVGFLAPHHGLFASFTSSPVLPGHLSFVSQSGALATAVLDWAADRNIGFAHCVSLGSTLDIDFGDVLDYLANDRHTRAILLHIEHIPSPRKFLSAARAAARNKPVIAIKAASAQSGHAISPFAARMEDRVVDAALRRAGVLRVYSVDALFDAVETLARVDSISGERLAILSNGTGPGFLALDALNRRNGSLAILNPETRGKLDTLLGNVWDRCGMVDVGGNAGADRYGDALDILLADSHVDAALVLYVPAVLPDGDEVVRRVVSISKKSGKNVLAACLGGEEASRSRRILTDAGLPTFDTPEHALRAFRHMNDYRLNRETLLETPPAFEADGGYRRERAASILRGALAKAKTHLDGDQVSELLEAYGIEVAPVRRVRDLTGLRQACEKIGFPLKLSTTTVDGTRLETVEVHRDELLEEVASGLMHRTERIKDKVLDGVMIEKIIRRPKAFALTAGMLTDAVFGPVLFLGHGGSAAEYLNDLAVALPPLNLALARELINRTRVSKLLVGDAERPPGDLDQLASTMMRLSHLLIDLPSVYELRLNPLFLDSRGVLAARADVLIGPASNSGSERLAIRPYPRELEEIYRLRDGRTVLLRPIRPEDEPAQAVFFSKLGPDDIRFRFFLPIREIPHQQMARYTQIDYDREMAFVAIDDRPDPYETLGVVRAVTDPDNQRAEFSVIIRPDLKRMGLGSAMMEKIIRYCRSRGTAELIGQVLTENIAMLKLASRLGFKVRSEDGVKVVQLVLNERKKMGGQ